MKFRSSFSLGSSMERHAYNSDTESQGDYRSTKKLLK